MRFLLLSTGRRSKVLVLVIGVLVAAAFASQAGKLDQVVSSELTDTLPKGAESVRALELRDEFPSANIAPAVVVFGRESGLTAADRRRVADAASRIGAARLPLALPPGTPQFAPDGSTALVAVPFRETDTERVTESVGELRELVGSTGGEGKGLRVAVTGGPAFGADLLEVFEGADVSLLAGAALLVFVLLILIYRSPVVWIIPFFTVVLAEAAGRGAGYLIGSAGLTITDAASGIVSVLVFGAATDYALLLVARYREELRRQEDTHAAMASALRGAGPAILASAGTVVAGLLTLAVAEVNGTAAIGPLGAASVALALAFSLTVLPASLLLAGRRVFWPAIPRAGAADEVRRGVWTSLGDRIARRPRRVWLSASAVLAVLALGITQLSTDLSFGDQFTGEVEATRGQALLAAGFPGGTSAPADVIVRDRADVPAVRAALEGAGDVVASVGRPEEGGPGVLVPVVLREDPYSPRAVADIPRLRDVVQEASPDALVGGPTAEDRDLRQSALRDTLLIPPLTLAVVLVILAVLLRAVVAPLLLLATVVASFAAALGAGLIFSEVILGVGSVDPSTPLIAFVFLVALGVDYNIFLMARAREEAARIGTRRGILAALTVTGGVITSAGVVLAGTFLILGVLPLVTLAQLGFIVAFGVLLDTLLVRSVLVPALVLDVGDRIWWPSRPRAEARPTVAEPARDRHAVS